eukprot:COSAG05_NODE_2602_length_2852_cov_13.506720_1_plen_487_part_00
MGDDAETARVLTLLGPVPACELGDTLSGERLVADSATMLHQPLPAAAPAELRAVLAQGVLSMGALCDVRRHPYASLVNLRLEASDASRELVRFARSGGSAAVEVTATRGADDVSILQRLSVDSRINIVAGTGWDSEWRSTIGTDGGTGTGQGMQLAELAAVFVRDLTKGFPIVAEAGDGREQQQQQQEDCTCPQRRAGLIGEIVLHGRASEGDSAISDADGIVLKAVAQAHAATGAPVLLKADPLTPAAGIEALDRLLVAGVPSHRLLITDLCHYSGLEILQPVLEKGCMLVVNVGCSSAGHEVIVKCDSTREKQVRLCKNNSDSLLRLTDAWFICVHQWSTKSHAYRAATSIRRDTCHNCRAIVRSGFRRAALIGAWLYVQDPAQHVRRQWVRTVKLCSAAKTTWSERGGRSGDVRCQCSSCAVLVAAATSTTPSGQGQVALCAMQFSAHGRRRQLFEIRFQVLQHAMLAKTPPGGGRVSSGRWR